MKTQNTMNIYQKLFQAKKKIGKISKDSTNPFFKSKYFDVNALLEHVEPILESHELLLLQPVEGNKVITQIIDIESGEKISSFIEFININDPQKLGSAITYFRRYTLQSLLGLQAIDDDGNHAAKPAPIVSNTPAPAAPAKPLITPEQISNLNQYENFKHIPTFLNACRMSPDQRATLENNFKKLQS